MLNGQALSVSLNEVESLGTKALRGAGTGWGAAEEIARATRWMAARGLDWSGPLLRLLGAAPVADHLRTAFRTADGLAGARAGDTWRLDACEPIWVLGILSAALYGRDLALDFHWEDGAARLQRGGGLSSDVPTGDLARLGPRDITIAVVVPAAGLRYAMPATTRRSTVTPETWQDLERYAVLTTVPASAQSRATGAGGGRVDAD